MGDRAMLAWDNRVQKVLEVKPGGACSSIACVGWEVAFLLGDVRVPLRQGSGRMVSGAGGRYPELMGPELGETSKCEPCHLSVSSMGCETCHMSALNTGWIERTLIHRHSVCNRRRTRLIAETWIPESRGPKPSE